MSASLLNGCAISCKATPSNGRMLIPQTVELSAGEIMMLEQKLDLLERHGFSLEPFGPSSFAITSVPALLPEGDYAQLVRQMVAELAEVIPLPGCVNI